MPKPPKPPKPAAHVWWAWRRPPGVRLRTGVLERLFETTSSNGGMLVHLDDGLLEALVATVADFNTLLSMRGVCVGLRRLVDQYQRRCLGDRIAAQMSGWHGKGTVIMRTVLDMHARRLGDYYCQPSSGDGDGGIDSATLFQDPLTSHFAVKFIKRELRGGVSVHGIDIVRLLTEARMSRFVLQRLDDDRQMRGSNGVYADDDVFGLIGAFIVRNYVRMRSRGHISGMSPDKAMVDRWIHAQIAKLPKV